MGIFPKYRWKYKIFELPPPSGPLFFFLNLTLTSFRFHIPPQPPAAFGRPAAVGEPAGWLLGVKNAAGWPGGKAESSEQRSKVSSKPLADIPTGWVIGIHFHSGENISHLTGFGDPGFTFWGVEKFNHPQYRTSKEIKQGDVTTAQMG